MQTLAVNADNELYVGANNSLIMATGDDAVAQASVRAASTTRGELQYAQKDGVNYLDTVFAYGVEATSGMRRSLFDELSKVTGVNNVSDLQVVFDPTTGSVFYAAAVITENGIITL